MRRPAASVSSGSKPPLSRRGQRAARLAGQAAKAFRDAAAEQRVTRAGRRQSRVLGGLRVRLQRLDQGRLEPAAAQLGDREVPPDADSQPEQPVLAAVRDEARGHLPDAEERLLHSGLHIHSSRERE